MDQQSPEFLLAESPDCTKTGVKPNSRKRSADVMDTIHIAPPGTRKKTEIWLIGQMSHSLKAIKMSHSLKDDHPVKRAIVDPAMIHSKELENFVNSSVSLAFHLNS